MTCANDEGADLEVLQALRRYVRSGELDLTAAGEAVSRLHEHELDLEHHGHAPHPDRAWALRNDFTANDAVYVALAEALDPRVPTSNAE